MQFNNFIEAYELYASGNEASPTFHAWGALSAGETVTYNPGGNSAPNGLSHVIQGGGNRQNRQRVPDGGSMLVLLGLGLTSIEAVRRKLSGTKAKA